MTCFVSTSKWKLSESPYTFTTELRGLLLWQNITSPDSHTNLQGCCEDYVNVRYKMFRIQPGE